MSPKEWHYHPDGVFYTSRILKKSELAFLNASKMGKSGPRAFADVSAFFIYGLENALFPYGGILEKQFSFRFYLCLPIKWMT